MICDFYLYIDYVRMIKLIFLTGEIMNWLKNFFYKLFGKSERKIFDKSDLEYQDSDNT